MKTNVALCCSASSSSTEIDAPYLHKRLAVKCNNNDMIMWGLITISGVNSTEVKSAHSTRVYETEFVCQTYRREEDDVQKEL